MLELLFLVILSIIAFLAVKANPFLKHYQQNRAETEGLVKKYNRILNARKELLGHFDWSIARGDPIRTIENLGREIERMDAELQQLSSEIQLLES